jgi:hypothetical protein
MHHLLKTSLFAGLVFILLATPAFAHELIDWQTISSGATEASSDSFSVSGSLGQTVVGATDDGTARHGFWQSFTIGNINCCTLRGDVNYNGTGPDIADLIYMVTYMFQQGPIPFCLGNADTNASGDALDISDVIFLVTFMFQQGAELPICP